MREGEEFLGNDRFEVITRLGQGGMGTVYQVHDRELKKRVALKTCGQVAGDKLLRFKREFRDLKSLVHPHIVALGELFEESGRWFFTMELVPGQTFLRHLRPPELSEGARSGAMLMPSTLGTLSAGAGLQAIGEPEAPPPVSAASFDELRLRRCLAQLATAIDAMHAHGHIHRDIKPSNVLVTPENRVVLIDFGLVTGRERERQSTEMRLTGTLLYMAPEQAAEKPLTPACDWYSFGVMLFQALTGRLPFEGQALQVMVKKQFQQAPLASSIVPGVPPDLDALCADLLRLDPKERPRGEDVLTALLVDTEKHDRANQSVSVQDGTGVFVGREAELSFLRERAARCLQGEQVSVLISGPSGIGKSALVQRFVEDLEAGESELLILRGRCFEHERVPFNALDGVLDQLSRWLKRAETPFAGTEPSDVLALSQAFPVLQRVPIVRKITAHSAEVRDPLQRRIRAMRALRKLFHGLASQRPLVMIVEDLQWSDGDSLRILEELMRPPQAPAMLMLFTDRRGPNNRAPGVPSPADELYARLIEKVDHLSLVGLEPAECERLAREIGDGRSDLSAEQWRALVDQSEGHPYFLATLVRRLQRPGSTSPETTAVNLDEVLLEILGELPERTRRLAHVICLAAGPLELRVAVEAAELEPGEVSGQLNALRVARFVRTTGPLQKDRVEPYHDRVREALSGKLDPGETQAVHRALARALELHRGAAHEIATHLMAAQDIKRAAPHFENAARDAEAALAFEHAAGFYWLAANVPDRPPEEVAALSEACGAALANVGRGHEAAQAYLDAAEHRGGDRGTALRMRAAGYFLEAGMHQTGLEILIPELRRLGISYPRTTAGALLQIARFRARLELRGLDYVERSESEIPPDELALIDALFSLAFGLSNHEPVRALLFFFDAIRRSLDAGEPQRVARALMWEGAMVAQGWPHDIDRFRQQLSRADAIGERVGATLVSASARFSEAWIAYIVELEYERANQLFADCEHSFRTECVEVSWQIQRTVISRNHCDFVLGNWRELTRMAPAQVVEARARGDHYLTNVLHSNWTSFRLLLLGKVVEAYAEVDEARGHLDDVRSPIEDFILLNGLLRLDLAAGDAEAARDHLRSYWPSRGQSLLIRAAPIIRFLMNQEELNVKLAMIDAELPGSRKELRRVKRLIRSCRRQKATPFLAIADYADAVLSLRRGDVDAAIGKLRSAAEHYRKVGMVPSAIACDARRGALVAEGIGAPLIETAHAWLREQGAVDPDAMLRMLTPGIERQIQAMRRDS